MISLISMLQPILFTEAQANAWTKRFTTWHFMDGVELDEDLFEVGAKFDLAMNVAVRKRAARARTSTLSSPRPVAP